MNFDKNQNTFLSKEHNAIWNLGIHVMPTEITLPPEVRAFLPSYMTESCEQMRQFTVHLLYDMYNNVEIYLPLPYQLSLKVLRPFIDFGLLGEAQENCLIINRFTFDKFIKKHKNSNVYDDDRASGINFEYRLNILKRVGLKIEYTENNVIFTNTLYPNMFYAIHEMAAVTVNEKASMDNSFTYCDFRKLCKSYKYDKYENSLIFLSDTQKRFAKRLDIVAKELNFTRSIKSGHCAGFGIEYNYKKIALLSVNCLCSHYENDLADASNNHKNNNVILQIKLLYDEKNPAFIDSLFNALAADSNELKDFVYKRLSRCRACYHKCPTYGGRPLQIYGKTNKMCIRMDFKLKTEFIFIGATKSIPFFCEDDLYFIEKILVCAKNLMDETIFKVAE